MGYGVYQANGRVQGYEIPAYCDYPGCREVIDRGMGYQHPEDNEGQTPNVFCCEKHKYEDLNSFEVEEKETVEWLNHILTDHSWKQWREDKPEIVEKYKLMLKEQSK